MIKRLFKNPYSFSVITKFTLVFLGVINSVLINRGLGPALKGEYAYFLNIMNILVLLLNLGIYQSYPFFKREKNDPGLRNRYFNNSVFQFLVYLAFAVLAACVVWEAWFTVLVILVPIMVLKQQMMFVAMIEDINARNRINILSQVIYTMSLALVIWYSRSSILPIFMVLYLNNILVIGVLTSKYKLRFRFKEIDAGLMREALRFGIFPMLSALLITMNYKLDVILLKAFVSYEQIGLYTVGVSLANQIWLIPDAFKDVLFHKSTNKDAVKDVIFSVKLNNAIVIPMIAIVLLFGKPILSILYGVEFVGSYRVTAVIFIGIIPMILFKLINPIFIAHGMQKESFGILLGAVVLNVIGNIVLIPGYGIVGAAVASVLSYSLCGCLFLRLFLNKFDVRLRQFFKLTEEESKRIQKFTRGKAS